MAYTPYTTAQVVQIIDQVAAQKGVNPNLAVATAEVESGLNPYSVGDQGTSFGLFQLHQGGELGSLTPSQAFDPTTNSQVALTEIASVASQYPYLSPGAIAAKAQRPANQAAYAQSVNAAYDALQAGYKPPQMTFNQPSAPISSSATTSTAAPPKFEWYNPSTWVGTADYEVLRFVFMILGLALVIVGVVVMFKTGSSPAPAPAPSEPAPAQAPSQPEAKAEAPAPRGRRRYAKKPEGELKKAAKRAAETAAVAE